MALAIPNFSVIAGAIFVRDEPPSVRLWGFHG
jgi:hypothetical protein